MTHFHLPDGGLPGHVPGKGYGGSVEGYVCLAPRTTVMLDDVPGLWRVQQSHFRLGPPNGHTGLHILLEPADK